MEKLTEGLLSHQDNAPVRRSTAVMAATYQATKNVALNSSNTLPYSPDLTPSG